MVPIQPPAINPNLPANAPTGPSAVSALRQNATPAEAGPSGQREGGDVEMGGQDKGRGQGSGSGSGRQRCFDYHGMFFYVSRGCLS